MPQKLMQIFTAQRVGYIDDETGGVTKSYYDIGKIYGDMREKFTRDSMQQKRKIQCKNHVITVSMQTGKSIMKYKNNGEVIIVYNGKKLTVKSIMFDKRRALIQL